MTPEQAGGLEPGTPVWFTYQQTSRTERPKVATGKFQRMCDRDRVLVITRTWGGTYVHVVNLHDMPFYAFAQVEEWLQKDLDAAQAALTDWKTNPKIEAE